MSAAAIRPAGIHIRRMLPADVGLVHALDALSFSLPWPESSYRFEVSENSNAIPLVAVNEAGGVVAMSVTWVIIDEAHVATIAVHPDYRRLGLGKRLLAASLLEAWERGALLSHLEVRRGNLAAQVLYADFGFEVVGERPRYYQDNHEDALLMTLDRIDPVKLRERMRSWAEPENS
jgi:[ribosomal protein S18]-alanine N-acetyltransferase